MVDEILFARQGPLAIVTLNRPAALNAQNVAMVRALNDQLAVWDADPTILRLLICGAGDRAFCAGGDVRALWNLSIAEQLDFFDTEYWMCYRLAQSRMQTIAYMDGITMGGGVGLSIFADIRLATPRTLWAMPETHIGFFPDIVASYFLPRLPAGRGLGRYLGVTGARLTGADCLATGIATHHVASDQTQALIAALANGDDVTDFATPPAETNILQTAAQLNAIADLPLPEFLAQLEALNLAPTGVCKLSQQIIDTAMRIGARLSYKAAVEMDQRIVRHFLAGDMFREGVRARLIDKDNQPNWPDSLLTDDKLLEFFV